MTEPNYVRVRIPGWDRIVVAVNRVLGYMVAGPKE